MAARAESKTESSHIPFTGFRTLNQLHDARVADRLESNTELFRELSRNINSDALHVLGRAVFSDVRAVRNQKADAQFARWRELGGRSVLRVSIPAGSYTAHFSTADCRHP